MTFDTIDIGSITLLLGFAVLVGGLWYGARSGYRSKYIEDLRGHNNSLQEQLRECRTENKALKRMMEDDIMDIIRNAHREG